MLGHIALNKTFMEVDGIGQLSRFHCIIKGRQRLELAAQSKLQTVSKPSKY